MSEAARQRLEWMIFYDTVGERNARRTAAYFGISSKTFHKWKKRFDPRHLEWLEDQAMTGLFAKHSIEIDASALRVWDVLTQPEFTRQWIGDFGGLDGAIVSDWALGSPVLWTIADGKAIVEGNVTAVEPGRLLRFTVFDVRSERPPVSETDGITFTLSGQNGRTALSVSQGDFAAMTDAEKYHQATVEVWKKVLPKIKALAEA